MTGLAKMVQVDAKHQNVEYFRNSVPCLLPVSCKCCILNYSFMAVITVYWLDQITGYNAMKLKNVVKFYVPTWSILLAQYTFN